MKRLSLFLVAAAMGAFVVFSCLGAKTGNTMTSTALAKDAAQAKANYKAASGSNTSAKHTFSELFTDDQIWDIHRQLGLPQNQEVMIEVGKAYYSENLNANLAKVEFYHGGMYCAGAACEVGTSHMVKSIYTYEDFDQDYKAGKLPVSELHSISMLFTDDQLREIATALGIPRDLKVSVAVGNSYWWDGAGMELAQVDFYHNGTYCAGAECQVHTSNVAKNIYSYEP